MQQKIQLQIPTPCHENWNNMTASQQGRFCMSCQKEVVDFSVMTDTEILTYISTASGKTCGRADETQLNRVLASPYKKRGFSFTYLWSVVITSALLSNRAAAQVKPPKNLAVCLPGGGPTKGETRIVMGKMQAPEPVEQLSYGISGTVTDENNQPLAHATVMIKGSSVGTATDTAGRFTLTTKESIKNIQLVVSYVGFTSQTIDCANPDEWLNFSTARNRIAIDIKLIALKYAVMGNVMVIAPAAKRYCGRTGGMVAGIRITTIDKAAIRFKDAVGINEIKSYPNPIAGNSEFQLKFSLKEPGEYTLRFTDALGRIIVSRQVNIAAIGQLETFNAAMLGGNGIYFASISNSKTAKTYTTRLLLQ